MAKKSFGSSARAARAKKSAPPIRTRRKTDDSDIPEASDQQLQIMRRVGRPPIGEATKQLIAIRLDPDVLTRVRRRAKQTGVGYQTLINDVLAKYARRLA
jgi:uncharacterized protein (DUF4415 family)